MMNIHIPRKVLYAALAGVAVFPFVVSANDPAVSSYKASETAINSGQLVTFSWTLTDAGGYSFVIPCSAGIVVKKTDGTGFNCDTPVATTQVTSDAISVLIHNVSGGTKGVVGRLTPKTGAGADYTSAMQERTVSVITDPKPFTSFTSSLGDTQRGKSVDISWTGPLLSGANLQIECRDEIKVSSPSYTASGIMPCGKIIFPADLSPSGSLSLLFSNSSALAIPYTLKLYPAITAHTSYDGTHALTLTLNVASDTIPDPVMTYVTASTTAVASGGSITLAWGSKDAVGVNVKYSCNPLISATSTLALVPVPGCDTYLFSAPLAPTGTAPLTLTSTGKSDEIVTISVIPSKQAGLYDAVRAKHISLIIHPAVSPALSPSASSSLIVSPAPAVSPVTSAIPAVSPVSLPGSSAVPPLSGQKNIIFTVALKRGSRGSAVSALQEFLKRDSAVYPEGLVTGYFGPVTEAAVRRFQAKYSIVSSGTPATTGYGAVGPKTREKLNALQ